MKPRPLVGLLAAVALAAACAAPGVPAPGAALKGAPSGKRGSAATGPARFFQGLPEESFWVTHDDTLDRVIAGGARLELAPSGQILAAGWDSELVLRGEALIGALSVPASQGGGFVHWSRARVFRSREFTGELEPVLTLEGNIRGARPGLSSVLVITDMGIRELLPGSRQLTPTAEPAILDAAALDASRALRLDLFGRVSTTSDGGKRWLDLSQTTGVGVRSIVLGERDLMIDTWQGRLLVGADGKLSPAEQTRASYEPSRFFQIAWKSTRATDREDWSFGYREATPLQAAILSGAQTEGDTGVGVIQGVTVRVDLATGKLVSMASDWIPAGLICQPLSADDGVLFACAWERYQGYGGYLLRSRDGAPPEPERAFTDDGAFVADDDGAIGYTGSCRAEPRLFDPEDVSRNEPSAESALQPILCVRKSLGVTAGAAPEWVERRVDLGDGSTLIAWIPRKDGTAVALVLSNDPLPERSRGARRVTEQSGVRVVRLYREIETYAFSRASSQPSGRGVSTGIDKRFAARADGSLDGWISPSQDAFMPIQIGVTIAPDGRPEVHEMPPGVAVMAATGDYGLAISARGELYETTDHGRSWGFAGASPIPPANFNSAGCSALGCSLGSVVRLGWGNAKLAPRVGLSPLAPPARDPLLVPPRLQCSPVGSPAPLAPPPAAPAGSKQSVSTGYGDTLELIRDQDIPEPAPSNPGYPSGLPFPPGMPLGAPSAAPSASAAAGKPPRSSPAVLRTHSLLWRPPFEPSASLRRLNATDASFTIKTRGATVMPLLMVPTGAVGQRRDASGDVSLLIAGDTSELLVSGDRITSLPAFEARRYSYGDTFGWGGLSLPSGHALMLGDTRRRLSLEEHGVSPPPPPLYLSVDRELGRRRPMTLGRRDDGAVGLLVFDGSAPATVGVADIDLRGEGLRGIKKLAPWSSLITADDPRCGDERDAYRALVILDPSGWFELDQARLPGVSLAKQGMALVRWGEERVCIEALDAAALDSRRRAEGTRSMSLVVRWGGREKGGHGKGNRGPSSAESRVNAALRAPDLRQDLRCEVARVPVKAP